MQWKARVHGNDQAVSSMRELLSKDVSDGSVGKSKKLDMDPSTFHTTLVVNLLSSPLSRHVLNCKWTLVLHTIIQENKAVWKIAFFQLQCTDVANEKELRAVTNRLKGTPRNLNSCNYLSICELYETQPILENHYVISILTNQGIVSYFTTIKMIEIHCCMDKNEKSLV